VIFGPQHYVPVLKLKEGEKAALRSINDSLRARMTPFLEVVVRNPEKAPTLAGHINTAFKGLARSVEPYDRCFLDTRELADDDADAASRIFARAADEGITFTPVTGISRVADVDAAMKHAKAGVALRLTREEFEAGGLRGHLDRFLRMHSLKPENIDLFLDVGAVDDMISHGIAALATAFLAEVLDHKRWRTFTLSGCAFPGVVPVERNSHAKVDRAEWLAWRDGIYARRDSVTRVPTFSDTAIQHPRGVEGFVFGVMDVSAVIRYTRPESWLLIKGEGTQKTPLKAQYPGLAKQLVHGHLKGEFAASNHCIGCAGVSAAARKAPGLGAPGVWRRLGTIHHITMVIEGLRALSWP